MSDHVTLTSGEIEWGSWVPWTSIPEIDIPLGPGVYEVVYRDDLDGERLQIGEAIKLHEDVLKYLFRYRDLKAVGGRIKAAEDVEQLLVRWTETENHHAVKSELMRLHLERFGRLPKHVIK
jgi:hypothetical protein